MKPANWRVTLAAVLVAVMLGAWWAALDPSANDNTVESPGTASSAPSPVIAVAGDPARSAGALRSFDDAARLLELGVSGDLSLDAHTRSALDVLLASIGPAPAEADFVRLEEALRRSMPGEAATQAIALVRRYHAYQRADALAQPAEVPASPAEQQALVERAMALRRQHFDDVTARALFGAEEDRTRLDMAMHALQSDRTLSPEQKAAQLAALADRPGSHEPSSAAAVAALSATQAQRAEWESRYQAYAEQKKAILAAAAPDMAAQLEAALRQHFQEEERDAARAYDRHHAR